jgi:hypothetical protein
MLQPQLLHKRCCHLLLRHRRYQRLQTRAEPHSDSNSDGERGSQSHSDGDSESDSHSHSESNSHSDGNGDGDGDSQSRSDGDSESDNESESQSARMPSARMLLRMLLRHCPPIPPLPSTAACLLPPVRWAC